MTDRATLERDIEGLQKELRDLRDRKVVLTRTLYARMRELETIMGRHPPIDRYAEADE